jgi:hypothetical protein
MSKSVESTRRELFKEWFDSLVWPMCEKCSSAEYIAWQGFNAALDLVEIELPAKLLRAEHDQDWHSVRNGTISACQRSINSINLGLKIK